jgi:hypothetical protein
MSLFEETTVFHVTHYKAGSRWVFRILKRCVGDRIVKVRADHQEVLDEPIKTGRVYSVCYLARERFDEIETPVDSRLFFVTRDLRDTLVSGYFSLKHSHPDYPEGSGPAMMRERLQHMSLDEGLLHTLDDWAPANAAIQRSWIDSGVPLIRYEDLLGVGAAPILEEILLDHCELGVSKRRLHRAIRAERFEQRSGGRKPGEEDIYAHNRKGIAGDWRNYFTEPLKEVFKDRYGDLLIAEGYETDNDW